MSQFQSRGFDFGQIIGQYDRGRKQAQEQNQLKAMSDAANSLQQGGDVRTAAQGLLQSGNMQGFNALTQLANQDRGFNATQDQRTANNTFREKSFTAGQANADRRFQAGRDDSNRNFSFRRDQAGAANARADRAFDLRKTQFDFNKRSKEFDIKSKRLAEDAKRGVKNTDLEQNHRKEFQGLTKDFRSVRDAYSRIKASSITPSAAGDLSLIFNYMKMLDPGSVVRESEFALAATAGSFGARIKGMVEKLNSGKFLEDSIRNDFIKRAGSLYEKRNSQYGKTSKQYQDLATRQGLDPQNVVLDHGQVQSQNNANLKEKYGLE